MQITAYDVVSLLGSVVISLLLTTLRRPPKNWLDRALRSRVGPSLEVKTMSRGECARSAVKFFALGLTAIWILSVLASIGFRLSRNVLDSVPALVVLFALSIFGLMGCVGGVYLLICAPFRPSEKNADCDVTN